MVNPKQRPLGELGAPARFAAIVATVVIYGCAVPTAQTTTPAPVVLSPPNDTTPSATSVSGYAPKTYPDGSGYFTRAGGSILDDNWHFSAKRDAMTDKKVITAYRKAHVKIDSIPGKAFSAPLGLFLDLSRQGSEWACVQGHDFPGGRATIRVDGNAAVTTDTEGCTRLTGRLDEQLRNGRVAKVRGYEWPYDYAKTFDVDLSGYSDVIEYLRGQR